MKRLLMVAAVAIIAAAVMATKKLLVCENVFVGKSFENCVSQMSKCPRCDGDMTVSYRVIFDWKICPSCHGRGYIPLDKNKKLQCNYCKNSGRTGYIKQYVPARVCKQCSYKERI